MRAGYGGGFAVEVASRSGHGGYSSLSRLMTDVHALALCLEYLCGMHAFAVVTLLANHM